MGTYTTNYNLYMPTVGEQGWGEIVNENCQKIDVALPVTGAVQMYAGSSAPTGWLICNGQAVSRTTYAALFAVIGTTYGAGDGSTTFNLPNLQGRVPIGVSDIHALGSTGGEETHTLIVDEIPSHDHWILRSPTSGAGLSGVQTRGVDGNRADYNYGLCGETGGSQPHNNMQPYVTLNYIIRV